VREINPLAKKQRKYIATMQNVINESKFVLGTIKRSYEKIKFLPISVIKANSRIISKSIKMFSNRVRRKLYQLTGATL